MIRPPEREDICAVILAGGHSRRMGFNKALLRINGFPLVENLTRLAGPLVERVIISANDPAPYRFLSVPIVPDLFPGQGPLAGIHSAMCATPHALYLILACDLPAMTAELLSRLIRSSVGWDAAVPRTRDGQIHPLSAVYRRTCLDTLDRSIRSGRNKVQDFIQDSQLRVRWLDADRTSSDDSALRNINDISDLQAYLDTIVTE